MGDEIRVTVIATGFDHGRARPRTRARRRAPARRATAARGSTSASAPRSRSPTTTSTSRRSCADAASAGGTVEAGGDGRLLVRGVDVPALGQAILRAGAEVHELQPRRRLEDLVAELAGPSHSGPERLES